MWYKNIKALRTLLKLSRREFADELKVAVKTVGKWERAEAYPQKRHATRIYKLIGERREGRVVKWRIRAPEVNFIMDRKGWDEYALAEHLGTHRNMVRNWVRGYYDPSPKFRKELEKLFMELIL